MNQQSLDLLEFDSLLALVRRYVGSDLGRGQLEQVTLLTDRDELNELVAIGGEALAYTRESVRAMSSREGPARIRFEGLPDPGPAAAKLRVEGIVLDAFEVSAILTLLERATEVRVTLQAQIAHYPRLSGMTNRLEDYRPLLRELGGKILPDGTLADHASVALGRIRRDIERQRKAIEESLSRFLRTHREDGILQEEFVTIKNDRFVIPVVPGAKKRVPGVVHGASGSGHTLFLEPLETIDLNNDLVRLNEEELREIHRILREMTDRLRQHAEGVTSATEVIGQLDLLFAKARFGVDFEAVMPTFSTEDRPRVWLKSARHPLLQDILKRQRKPLVPVTLELHSTQRTLLISGPNTGGKTVAMKTVGLLALMAQSGLPVPADEAEFPVFEQVLADIGDQQSIEQSLSSFSAHVARIKEMIEEVGPTTLVLLDELGRATDPEEGGALGVAIVDAIRRAGAFTLASTHLLALKVYGASTEGVLNASMGFNEETLAPTYVLRTGAPGKSAGLEIATRIGLPPWLIDRARAALSSRENDLARLLTQLETKLTEANQRIRELEQKRLELEAREQALERDAQKKESVRLRELDRAAQEALARFDAQAKETIESVFQSGEQRRDAERALRQVARTKRELRESVENLVKPQNASAQAAAPKELKEGARVRLKDVRELARIRKVNSDGTIEVDLGVLKMQVAPQDVIEVLPESAGGGTKLPKGVTFSAGPRWDTLTREINVIGKTAEDALNEVDKFLDTATLAEVVRVRVVHGHGQGILRKAIGQLLAKHPAVEKYYPGTPQEGGTGATIVELKGG